MLREPKIEEPALEPKAKEGSSCPSNTDIVGATKILSGILPTEASKAPGIESKKVIGAKVIDNKPYTGKILLEIEAKGATAELGTDKGTELLALLSKLVAKGNSGNSEEAESTGIEGALLLGAKLEGKVDEANELGNAPELATEDKGMVLDKLPERLLEVPKLEGILPGAKPEEEAKGKPKDSGVARPLD